MKPTIHTRERWHYQDSDADLIRRFIGEFNRDRVFASKHVDDKVFIFNKVILNILSNFIPDETMVFADKDPLVQQENKIFD